MWLFLHPISLREFVLRKTNPFSRTGQKQVHVLKKTNHLKSVYVVSLRNEGHFETEAFSM